MFRRSVGSAGGVGTLTGGILRWLGRRSPANVAMIFGLSLVPMLVAAGTAVDLSRAIIVRARLSKALDAAGLAVGSSLGLTNSEIQTLAKNYFDANYPQEKLGVPSDLVVTINGSIITMSAKASVTTTLLGLIGYDFLNVATSSEITRSSNNLEVALALDTTGSMGGQKISDLKEAAKDLIDLVIQAQQSPTYSKAAVVPYSNSVNAGNYDDQVRGAITNTGTCNSPGCKKYKFKNVSGSNVTFTVSSCVTERTGSQAYTDASPSSAKVGLNYPASNNPCIPNEIVPLTSNKTTLKNAVNALQASGSTAGHIGIAWAWYMLSPNFGYIWPGTSAGAPYGTEKLFKVAVIMTDGEFNTGYCNGVIAKDSGSGSGSSSDHINCNATNGSSFSQATELCKKMKEKGIIIYTVGFDLGSGNQAAKDVVNQCATSPQHVYLPESGVDLKDAFRSIAQDITNLRLSK
ncbi:MAG: hypothetical protein H6923_07095 [Alphaproteobacteria bacterium]|nr:hypothetical protein [Alphaproteobacteria bacterium]